MLDRTDVFTAGEDGIWIYRNPALAATRSGHVLLFCEARHRPPAGVHGDYAPASLVLRRSTDGGDSWGPTQVLATNAHGPAHNPTPVHDPATDAVHFLYGLDYEHLYYTRTDDGGATFSDPVAITSVAEEFRPEYDWTAFATGIGHAIVLSTGRIVVPVWMALGTQGPHRPSVVASIYSDDAGRTWHRGELLPQTLRNPSETQPVELSDGRVLFSIRNESPERRRAWAVSPDGATGWSSPQFDPALFEPICCAAILRAQLDGRSAVVYLHPNPPEPVLTPPTADRNHLTLRASFDDCRTWPVARLVDPGIAGYSDLPQGPDGTLLCAYGRDTIDGNPWHKKHVSVSRVEPGWLLG
jgi:sialidase-1